MFRLSSSILNPEPALDVIQIEELGTISLEKLVNQLSNQIDPAMWNDSNFNLVNISVYAIFKGNRHSHGYLSPHTQATPSHTGLQSIVRSIIFFQTNIRLNLKTAELPGFESGSPGLKAAMVLLHYAPLTNVQIIYKIFIIIFSGMHNSNPFINT